MARKAQPLIKRFWRYVDKSGSETGCWEWTASRSVGGYGMFYPDARSKIGAHRFSWFLAFGPIAEGLQVCHRCDNRRCVRPDHLFLGTHQDNADDMKKKGRSASGERNGSRRYPERLRRGADRGPRKPRLPANETIAAQIKGMKASGIRKCDIALAVQRSKQFVHDVLRGKSYRNVEPIRWEK